MVSKLQTVLKLLLGAPSTCAQTILVNTWHEPTAYDETGSREQRIQLISLLTAKRYILSS